MSDIEKEVADRLNARRGLKRKFFTTVVLPPLVPLVVLGIAGTVVLSGIIRNSLIDQLERAAATTAARADREFSIRETVLKDTAEGVIDLSGKRAACQAEIDTAFPNRPFNAAQEHSIIDNPVCEPFLAEFARRNTELRNVYSRYAPSFSSSTLPAAASNEFNRIYSSAVESEYQKKTQDFFKTFAGYFPETLQIFVTESDQALSEFKKENKTSLIADDTFGSTGVALRKNGETVFVQAGYEISKTNIVYVLYDVSFLRPTLEAAPLAHPEDNIAILENSAIAISLKESNRKDVITKSSSIGSISGWTAEISSPSSLVLAPLRQAQILSVLAVLVSLMVSLIVGFFFVSSATNAIRRLLTGAITFAQGKFDQKIYLASGDELQTLAETMNDMAHQIKAAQNALVEKSKEFIYVATHELKAPLTAIIGYLSLIVDDGTGKVDKQAKEFITQAYGSTVQLRDLVADLLDIARLEAKKEQFTIAPIELTDIVKDILEMQAITAKQRGITVKYEPQADLPKTAADENKLRIIITNFVSNAIKYNKEKGTVTISHEVEDGQISTSIADTGLGIPKEQQAMMFNKFFRVKDKDRADIPGTGLGLYVTRQYIEKMGGRVWFESEQGKGTTFHFTLPIAG